MESCKALDSVSHNILVFKLERWVSWVNCLWIKNGLGCHIQRVVVDNLMSRWRLVTSDVPQVICIGAIAV